MVDFHFEENQERSGKSLRDLDKKRKKVVVQNCSSVENDNMKEVEEE